MRCEIYDSREKLFMKCIRVDDSTASHQYAQKRIQLESDYRHDKEANAKKGGWIDFVSKVRRRGYLDNELIFFSSIFMSF